MHIVGMDWPGREETHVHTIDIWFSDRRELWIVERLNANGDPIGMAHPCASEGDAAACLAEWLRAHPETHLVTPRDKAAVRRVQPRAKRRAA